MKMENIREVSVFQDHVRKRPYLYIGGKDITSLFKGLILDCIKLCGTDEILFKIRIIEINSFAFEITSNITIAPIIHKLNSSENNYEANHPIFLKFISEKFEVINRENSTLEINFSLDKAVILNTDIDYLKLYEAVFQIACLNRGVEIITIDKRQKYLNQNYFHYPQGIFYLFERAIDATLGHPEIKMTYDGKIGANHYQIALACRTDWFPEPNIISYANDNHNINGGSLVDGVLEGFLEACKKYVDIHKLTNYKISEEKLMNGLIVVCAVRGENFIYGGSFRETLQDDLVKEQSKVIMADLAFDFFENNKEKVDKFFFRFDSTQFMSGMF
ncbi:MAG: hypothetical protein GC192_15175 [Bacteroidetes bacterium]|nr:hypothetical protein [Bacteroidota bacterium]